MGKRRICIYCKEVDSYYYDINSAAWSTGFTHHYVKSCVDKKYIHPWYYHFDYVYIPKGVLPIWIKEKPVNTGFGQIIIPSKPTKENKVIVKKSIHIDNEPKKEKMIKKIICLEKGKVYDCADDVVKDTGCRKGYILACCNGKIEHQDNCYNFEYVKSIVNKE